MSQQNKYGLWNVAKFATGTLILGVLTATVPLFTQKTFDPSGVMPQDCKNGKLKCGFVPIKAAERKLVKSDTANLVRHRGLPSSVDLSSKMPPIGNQGRQGSCVGWASAYAVKSYQEHVERGWSYGDPPQGGGSGEHFFSPAYVYNQINGGQDRGSSPYDALQLMQSQGVAPWSKMPYTDSNYTNAPSDDIKQSAYEFRIESFTQLEDIDAIKSVLAKGNVVLAGIKVHNNFYQLGEGVYDAPEGNFMGGHAIALVGYDDSKGFKIFNSWGAGWGNRGYGWISFNGWSTMGLGAFGVYDLKANPTPEPTPKPSPEPTPGPGPGPSPDVPDVPVAPENAKVTAPSSVSATKGIYTDKVIVSWSGAEGAVGYEVQRAEPGAEEYSQVGLSNSTSFEDSKVMEGAAYKYRVISVGEGSKSSADDSPVAEGFAKARAAAKPDAVTGAEGNANEFGVVMLSWNAVEGATGYHVIRYNPAARNWQWLTRNNATAGFADDKPQSGANYYRVCAYNSQGTGEWSQLITVQVAGRSESAKPGKVAELQASQGQYPDGVALAWQAVSGASGYYVVRYDPTVQKWSVLGKIEQNNAKDQSDEAKSGRQFGYTVVAFNGQGNGEPADPVIGFARAGQYRGVKLDTPAGVTGKLDQSKGELTISWKPVKDATEYYVFSKKQGEREFKFIGTAGKNVSYVAKIPSKGVMFLYKVSAKNFYGESLQSKPVSGFINQTRSVVRHRFTDDGFGKFKGNWKAQYWDGESAPQDIVITLDKSGGKFTGLIARGGKTTRVSGDHVAMSGSIEGDGFKMKLTGKGVSKVEIVAGGLDISLTFVKQ